MTSFLSKIPQSVPFEDLLGMDPNLETAIRDVASTVGMPSANSQTSILDALASVETAHMLHDDESRDSLSKGVIRGLLIGAALPKLCQDFLNSKQQPPKGTAP